jgi:poly-gamma-glutamate synthesis protein (capsule biosynthesis protein)
VARALSDAGYNILAFASNHTLDWGEDSVLDTIDIMKKNRIKLIGVGKTVQEAKSPAIFDIKGTKVGFLTFCTVMPHNFVAEQLPGQNRACMSGVKVSTAYQAQDAQPGTTPLVLTYTNPKDLKSIVDNIKALRSKVDVLILSMHWGLHFTTSAIAMYEYEIGHAAIDAGADMLIGTHAHTLKGIEVYKGKIILHCIGNFIMDLPIDGPIAKRMARGFNVSVIPSVAVDEHNRAANRWAWEVDPEHPTYAFPVDCQKSVIVKCTIENKKITRTSLLPVWINGNGQPEPLSSSDPRNQEIYKYMQWLCRDQKLYTQLTRERGEIVIHP